MKQSALVDLFQESRTQGVGDLENRSQHSLGQGVEVSALMNADRMNLGVNCPVISWTPHQGLIKLCGYQVAGSSSQKLPNWRWAEQDLISDLQLLDRTFLGAVPPKSGKQQNGDKLFIRVKPHYTEIRPRRSPGDGSARRR